MFRDDVDSTPEIDLIHAAGGHGSPGKGLPAADRVGSTCAAQGRRGTGAVSGGVGSDVGGLAGETESTSMITDAYATGAVTGGADAGGLVGINQGTITNAFATGAVSGANAYRAYVQTGRHHLYG